MTSEEQLRLFKSVQGYTLRAVKEAIEELNDALVYPVTATQLAEILRERKEELENILEQLESIE